jgi:1,4-dihydroxy-2-naphthoate octaprenyltransferase
LDLSGIGEIITSTILVIIPPALAFLLQFESFHRLIPLIVFPLFPFNFAMIIVLRLRRYQEDINLKRKTILVRLGWVQGIFIHNLLVLGGFFLFGLSAFFGAPLRIIGPVFFVLPIGFLLIWYLSRLKDGAPVRWKLIIPLSLVEFFLPLYLLVYSLWTR